MYLRYMFRKHGLFFIGILLLIVSVLFLTSGLRSQKRCTEEVTGTIIDYELSRDDEDGVTYTPVASFTVDGTLYELCGSYGSSNQAYSIGEEVTICYNPSDPSDFIFKGDHTLRKIGIYLFFVSLFLMAVDVLYAVGILPLGDRR